MSAIFGLRPADGAPVDRTQLGRLDTALAAHGHDGGGLWADDGAGLGCRLAAFTAQDGLERQPLASADDQRVLVFDGRIDDRRALLREFDLGAAEAEATPDSALVLQVLQRWGEAGLARLHGSYAFACWDRRTQTLLAGSSPLNGRSLCYVHTPRHFAFATLPGALLALPFVERRLDEEHLADLLVYTVGAPEDTCWRGIRRLPPGQLLTLDGHHNLRVRPYGAIEQGQTLRFARDDDCADAVDELFDTVVDDHLRSAAPVGLFMSGGLDSCSIAAAAAGRLGARGQRLAAFTERPAAGFGGPVPAGRYADESPLVQAMAQQIPQIDLHLVRAGATSPLEDTDALFDSGEVAFPNVANRPWWETILAQAQTQGVRVMLTGDGGNVSASWNGRGLLPGLLRQGRWGSAWREARALAQRGHAPSASRALLAQGMSPLLPTPAWHALQRWRGRSVAAPQRQLLLAPIHPGFAAATRVLQRASVLGAPVRPPADTRKARHDALLATRCSQLEAGYRARFRIDIRHPLVDRRLVEFCLALPEDQFLHDGVPRWLLRRAMAGRLPPAVLDNHGRGLQAADWYLTLGRDRPALAAELAALEHSDLARRMLDLPRLRRLLEHWPGDGWGTAAVLSDYRLTFSHGLMMGRYLRWLESRTGTPAA
ncbi:asparagine synthase-related protein [Rubrivivax gelatinosus]|uniref:asparagine synthase (glutamine-hydrolyzing) n=1 Tax=Rubrivivax gelatinosus TaxID=28068 RepID=A0ABS1DYC6_RUBGE|nr:hypothetical protein [Rubrivivax gelatinosus]